MNAKIRNPKAEGRRPKEGRDPKAEGRKPKGRRRGKLEEGFLGDLEIATWSDVDQPDLVLRENPPNAPLDERTAEFGEAVIRFAKRLPQNPVNSRLISQLVGAGTSIGANFCEADDSISGKEFKQKIGTCRKESKETMFFLRMVACAEPSFSEEARCLWREAKELNLIFGAIWRK